MNRDQPSDPDDYQQAWQTHTSQTHVTIYEDLLLKEVQRDQRNFRAAIYCRDFTEIGIALLLIPVWFYLGITTSSPWTWYLTVPVLIWLAGFMFVYRIRHKQKPSQPDEPLLDCVERSLTEIENQIWLLRNIFWWYLLPPTLSIMAFFAHITWLNSRDLVDVLGYSSFFLFLFGIYYFIYFLNQRAIRIQLEPRRQELLVLQTSLSDESTDETSHDDASELSTPQSASSPNSTVIALTIVIGIFVLAVLVSIGSDYLKTAVRNRNVRVEGSANEYAKKSPFAGVRWNESQPEVKLGEEWFQLVSLNKIPSVDIVAFSQMTYGDKWRKRFEEDLVELLTRMEHPPQETVTLEVKSLTSPETQIRENVPMTEANRRAIRRANREQ